MKTRRGELTVDDNELSKVRGKQCDVTILYFFDSLDQNFLQHIQSIMLEKFMEGCRTGNISTVEACPTDSTFDPNAIAYSAR